MKVTGKVFKYGDNVDTDVIIPARYLNTSVHKELAAHCMEDIDADFVKNVQEGDIIVANKNFGCGSSREHAPLSIKASGVSCVIAETFARIFYRNSINIGLPIIECPEAAIAISAGDEVEVVVELKNDSKNMTDWYMANDIATKMEKSTAESGGAYTYILRYIDSDGKPTELYNSKAVDVAANDSFAAAQKNGFYLDRLGAGEKASVSLYMKLDGETVNNDYQGGNIEMNLDFTVEEITSNTIKKEVTKIKEETVITYEPPVVVAAKGASTGDSAPVMVFSMIAFASAAALAVIAIKMMKKNRKEEGVQ